MAIGTEISVTAAASAFGAGAGVIWAVFTIAEGRVIRLIRASRKAHEVAYHGRIDDDKD
jgi:hypothetical protein